MKFSKDSSPETISTNGDHDDKNAKPGPDSKKPDGDFSNFRICTKTVKKLVARNITSLFPIQAATYDFVRDGLDVVGQAKTGTGKTLSFVLPICETLRKVKDETRKRPPKVVCLAPTRELALQIAKEFEMVKSKHLTLHCFYGGTPYDQQNLALRGGLDILVGTPGRILDHINRETLDLSKVRHVILDEADRMLDMGFQESIDTILQACYKQEEKPQVLLFSATMPEWVSKTAEKYMTKDRKVIDLVGQHASRAATSVEHKAICCPYKERAATLADVVQVYSGVHGRCIIFASTKKEANELSLNSQIKQETQVLHGDINQAQREITLQGFREGRFKCLVATDVASRGLDIPEVDLVVQCEPPKDVDDYIHRSGRTGRAGRTGVCIVFYKRNQEELVKQVERKAGIKFERVGAPQPSEIIKASVDDAVKSIEMVQSNMLPLFRPAADELIERLGASDALAAALAMISGNTEMKSRSLLSSYEGFITLLISQNLEMRGLGLIWKLLRDDQPSDIADAIRGVTLCKGRKSAVFDVPADMVDRFKENWKERSYATLSTPTVLPELEEKPQNFQSQWRGSNERNFSQKSFSNGRQDGFRNFHQGSMNNRKRRIDTGGNPLFKAKKFRSYGQGN